MKKSFSSLLDEGYQYMEMWPNHTSLYVLFRESQVIRLTRIALKVVPPIVIATLMLQFNLLPSESWPAALSVVLLLISIPVQCLLWLGNRANTLLPPSMASWYTEISEKMRDSGVEVTPSGRPYYRDLAILLKQAFGQVDKASLQRWL